LGKKSTEKSQRKNFLGSQTFFNLTNKTKIIPVINCFRKKGNKMFFSLREKREIYR